MSNPNISQYGIATQFTSQNQPEDKGNPGRKRNLFNYLKEDYSLSQNDLDNIVNHISTLPLEEVDRLLALIKTQRNAEEVRKMPLLYYKILEGMVKAKTNDILQFMKMSGKASEKHELTGKDGEDLFGAYLKNLREE
jgi:hypothetical protein